MGVAVGDIVLYTLNDADVSTINAVRAERIGPHTWNAVAPEQTYPAWVTKVNPDGTAQLKIGLDGDDFHWRQYAAKATGNDPKPGFWAEKSDWKPL